MSGYVVSDKTLNRILNFMSQWKFYGDDKLKRMFWESFGYKELSEKEKESLNSMSVEEETAFILQKIGQIFRNINQEAVNQRYNEKKKAEHFDFKFEMCDIFQAYNHIRCLTYQMLEGNVPETQTYKFLEEVEKLMAVEIANEDSRVKKADWDAN